jgi:hypothetical protein
MINTTHLPGGIFGACCMLLLSGQLFAQPYVDPLQVSVTRGFKNKQAQATPFTRLWIGSDIPIQLKKNTYLLLSPFYEHWQIDSANTPEIVPKVQGLALPVGLILPLANPKWSLTMLTTFRWAGEALFAKNTFQLGGVAFASYALQPTQKIRFGMYMNQEAFGIFIVPLFGIDWRMNSRDYLFGILPGRLSYEHQWNKLLYWGATFRSLTNSYRLSNGHYLRLDDNQLSAYIDYYAAQNICVTLEPGYGLFRKLRTGINDKNYLTNRQWGDGAFIKLSAAYRIRL